MPGDSAAGSLRPPHPPPFIHCPGPQTSVARSSILLSHPVACHGPQTSAGQKSESNLAVTHSKAGCPEGRGGLEGPSVHCPAGPPDLTANLSVSVRLSLSPPAPKVVTHPMEMCACCCRCTAWLPAPAAPTTHGQGFQPAQGAQPRARARGDRRATSTSFSLTLAWCLCAQLRARRGLSPVRAWGPRSRAHPLPLVPVRAGVLRGWVGDGGASAPSPPPQQLPVEPTAKEERSPGPPVGTQAETYGDTKVTCGHGDMLAWTRS